MNKKLLGLFLGVVGLITTSFSQTYSTGAANWQNVWDQSSGKFDLINGVGLFSFGGETQGRIEGRFFTTDGTFNNGTTGGTQRTVKPGQRIRIRIAGQDGGGRDGIVNDGIIGVSIKSGGGIFDGGESLSGRYDNNSILKIEFVGGQSTARFTNGSGFSTVNMPNFAAFKAGVTYDIEVISDREFNLVIGSARNNIQRFNADGSESPALIHIRNSGANMDGLFTDLAVTDVGVNLTANESENFTVIGVISNNDIMPNVVSKNGTGTVTLTSSNTYTGLTTINAGTLRLNRNGGGTLPAANNVTLASGGTLQVSSNQTLNDLSVPEGSTLIVDADVTLTINGTFSGSGTINNNGTIAFTGAENGVAINSGTVEYNRADIQTIANGIYSNLTISNAGLKSLAGATTVNDALTLSASSITNIGANTLTLNGTIAGDGALRGGTSANVTIGGSGALGTLVMDQTIVGANVLQNLTMNRASETLTLGDTLRIAGVLDPLAGDIESAGFLKLVSNANGNARVAARPDGSNNYITGNVTVERFIPNDNPAGTGADVYRRWRFFSMPVTGTSLRQFFTGKTSLEGEDLEDDGDATQNNIGTLITGHRPNNAEEANPLGFDWWPSLKINNSLSNSSVRFYSPANGFSSASNTPEVTTTTPDQQGYMVFIRGDRRNTVTTSVSNVTTLPSLGELRTGNQIITIPEASTTLPNYTALGNPFVSPIDFGEVLNNNSNADLIQPRFWMWDPHLANTGAWRLVKLVSGTWRAVPTPFTDDDPAADGVQHIQAGQAVLVEPIGSGSTRNLLIQENDKSDNTGNATIRPFDETGGSTGVLQVNLLQANKDKFDLADGVLATVAAGLKEETNDADDVVKPSNTFSALGVALLRTNRRLATEGRPSDLVTDTLFLQTSGLVANQPYRYSVKASGAPLETRSIQLIDRFTNVATNLPLGTITDVDFTPTSDVNSTATNRFIIVMNGGGTLPVNITRLTAREQQGDVQVEWAVASETGVKQYEVQHSTTGANFARAGVVKALNNGSATYSFVHQQPGSGQHFYRLRSEDTDGTTQLSKVVKVNIGSSQKGFSVYPTLVSGNSLTVELSGLNKGRYTLQLNDMAGKMLMSTTLQYDGGSVAQNLQLPAGLAAGAYLIRLQGEGNSYHQRIMKD